MRYSSHSTLFHFSFQIVNHESHGNVLWWKTGLFEHLQTIKRDLWQYLMVIRIHSRPFSFKGNHHRTPVPLLQTHQLLSWRVFCIIYCGRFHLFPGALFIRHEIWHTSFERDIYQEGHEIIEQFTFYNFTFLLVGIDCEFDSCSCSVSTCDFCIQLRVICIDSSTPCGPYNVDFIHFGNIPKCLTWKKLL